MAMIVPGGNGGAMVSAGQAGMTMRNEMGAEIEWSGEVNVAASIERARAEVQAAHLMARQHRRNWDDVLARLLLECQRSSFAERALYCKPIGNDKSVEGLSIHFARAAFRAMGNIKVRRAEVQDDAIAKVIEVSAIDFETNAHNSLDIRIEKRIERASVRDGQDVLYTRTNSRGKMVYIVAPSEGELLTKQRSEEAKAWRTVVLDLVPEDIKEECEIQIRETLRSETQKDPSAAKKKILRAFGTMNILPSGLGEYLGHPLDEATPAEIDELRGIYQAIKGGDVAWHECVTAKRGESSGDDEKAVALKEKLREARKKKATPATTPEQPRMREPGEDG